MTATVHNLREVPTLDEEIVYAEMATALRECCDNGEEAITRVALRLTRALQRDKNSSPLEKLLGMVTALVGLIDREGPSRDTTKRLLVEVLRQHRWTE